MSIVQIMKALSDETRLRILNILKDGELCVCEIEAVLEISQSNASRHLTKLVNAEILEWHKVTKYVYYKINEETVKEHPFINDVIRVEAIKLKQCQTDYERLKKHKKSGLNCSDLEEGNCCFNK